MSDRNTANFTPSFFPTVATGPAAAGTRSLWRRYRSHLLAGVIGLIGVTQAAGAEVCRPALAIKEAGFSEMRPPSLERTWTAVVSVDASRCATTSGRFGIVLSRSKENGLATEFQEKFVWRPASVTVSVDLWADEAVERYRLIDVAACPCRD